VGSTKSAKAYPIGTISCAPASDSRERRELNWCEMPALTFLPNRTLTFAFFDPAMRAQYKDKSEAAAVSLLIRINE